MGLCWSESAESASITQVLGPDSTPNCSSAGPMSHDWPDHHCMCILAPQNRGQARTEYRTRFQVSTIDKPNSSLQPPTDRSKIIFRTANEWAEPRVSLVGTSYNHHQPLYVDGFACQRCKTDIHRAEAEKYTPKGWGIPRPDLYEVRCLPRGRGVLEEVRFVGD